MYLSLFSLIESRIFRCLSRLIFFILLKEYSWEKKLCLYMYVYHMYFVGCDCKAQFSFTYMVCFKNIFYCSFKPYTNILFCAFKRDFLCPSFETKTCPMNIFVCVLDNNNDRYRCIKN
jgi:hypothetical protein